MVCNPIIDWTDADIWEYIEAEKLPVNPLYQCGFSRVGCIGCPMAGTKGRQKEFTLFGFDAAGGLQEDGFVEWNRIRIKGVTLAAVLSLLQPHENVLIMHRISLHELEAIGGGTVEELRAIQCVETCGGCEAERLELTVDDLTANRTRPDKPVLVITIGEKEAEA